MLRNDLSIKAEATGLVVGIGDAEWEEYLLDLINTVDSAKIRLDWDNAFYPLPKQLRNPCVVKEFKNGDREYVSSQLWLKLNKHGDRELLIPDETSGVILEGETGKVLRPLNGLPLITPDDTDFLIRIHIREKTNPSAKPDELDMNWCLYTKEANLS